MASPSLRVYVCAMVLLATASASRAGVYFQNEGDKRGWPNYPQSPQNLGVIENVANPVFKGSSAISFEQTYVDNATERYHSEVTYHTVQRNGEDKYYGFAMRLDSNWQLTDLNRDTWQQWGRENPGGPWILFRIDRDKVRISGGGIPGPSGFTITPGVWYSFVTRLQMTNPGLLELWTNGTKTWTTGGDLTVVGDTVRWSAGLYVSYWYDNYRTALPEGYQRVRRLYQDHYRIAESYAEAEPANWDDGATPPTPVPTPRPRPTATPTGAPTATATPTPTPLPGPRYEAELIPVAGFGAATAVQTDAKNSGGKWMALLADGIGDYVEYILRDVPAGTYDLWMKYKSHPSRGILNMHLDGWPIGPASLDQYSNPQAYPQIPLGTVRLAEKGDHILQQTVLGKRSNSGAYTLSADLFTFVPDAVAPVIQVPEDFLIEATSAAGASLAFSATATDDKDGEVAVTFAPPSGSTFPLGETTVTATASDSMGNQATATFVVSVTDTTAPVIERAAPSTATLWPPNHKMQSVDVAVQVAEAVDAAPSTRIVGVTSSEPTDGTGDGHIAGDWRITGHLSLELRAERAGGGGRVYTITLESRDASGNAGRATVTVTASKSQRP